MDSLFVLGPLQLPKPTTKSFFPDPAKQSQFMSVHTVVLCWSKTSWPSSLLANPLSSTLLVRCCAVMRHQGWSFLGIGPSYPPCQHKEVIFNAAGGQQLLFHGLGLAVLVHLPKGWLTTVCFFLAFHLYYLLRCFLRWKLITCPLPPALTGTRQHSLRAQPLQHLERQYTRNV